jgi:hypothetical protein
VFHSYPAGRARNKKPRSRTGFGVDSLRNSTRFNQCARRRAR